MDDLQKEMDILREKNMRLKIKMKFLKHKILKKA